MAYLFFVLFLLSLLGIWDHPADIGSWLISLVLFAGWIALGRWERNKHTARWKAVAQRVHGKHLAQPADDVLQQFGRAPWHTWARAMAVRALDTISGTERQRAFWLLEMKHHEEPPLLGHQGGGVWYPTSFAIVRLSGPPTAVLQPLAAPGKLKAMHNGGYLFVWREAWGGAVGKALHPDELRELLKVALDLAPAGDRTLPAPAGAIASATAGRPRAKAPKVVEADRGIPVFVLLAWVFVGGAPFLPSELSPILLTPPALLLAFAGLDLRRVWSTCHFALLAGCALAATFSNAWRIYGMVLGVIAFLLIEACANSKNTHRDARGRLLWGHRDEA